MKRGFKLVHVWLISGRNGSAALVRAGPVWSFMTHAKHFRLAPTSDVLLTLAVDADLQRLEHAACTATQCKALT
jgi:hypothetical protein